MFDRLLVVVTFVLSATSVALIIIGIGADAAGVPESWWWVAAVGGLAAGIAGGVFAWRLTRQ